MTRFYGNIMNRIMEEPNRQQEPVVGMGATICMHSDRHAGTIIDVTVKGHATYVTVQRDNAKRTDNLGMSDSQDYDYTPNPEGGKEVFKDIGGKGFSHVSLNPITGRYVKSGGYGLVIGHRDEHYDFNF